MKIKPFARLGARILDYFLFFLGVKFTFTLIGNPLSQLTLLLFALFLPLFWIPFEGFFTARFGKTPGYALFGLRVKNNKGRHLSRKIAYARAFFLGIKVFSPINLLYPILFLANKHESHFDLKHNVKIEAKKSKRVLATLLLTACFTGWLFEEQVFESPKSVFSLIGKNQNWHHFTHPEGMFAVDFPKTPSYFNEAVPIPGKSPLKYHEYYFQDGEVTYSVSYSKLPRSWVKWGSGLVLKGALKAIAAHLPKTEIAFKKSINYQSIPGLNFVFKQKGNQEVQGRLLLQGNLLYKLEVRYPKGKGAELKEKIQPFLNSFTTDPSQFISNLEEEVTEPSPSLS